MRSSGVEIAIQGNQFEDRKLPERTVDELTEVYGLAFNELHRLICKELGRAMGTLTFGYGIDLLSWQDREVITELILSRQDWGLTLNQKVLAMVSGYGGGDLDRFSQYKFGTFSNRLRGFSGSGIRYTSGVKATADGNWKVAIDSFNRIAAREPKNADVQNHLGYAWRKSGNLDLAFKHYNEALRLDPKHKGAHEYIGEAYLMANNLAKAEEHLARLDKLCFFSCDEYRDLKKAIEDYKRRGK